MRVLGRIRLSRATDESTSPHRQREIIEQWASAHEHSIVGWAEDLDVSGGVDPFDTPGLGPWLNNRCHEWDILAAWKLDRLGRRAIPLNKLFGWTLENRKVIVCVSDNIDLSTWVGRMVAGVIAGVAEGELEAIRERTKGSHRKLRELGRWPGGSPVYGYQAVQKAGGAGWELVLDPVSSQTLLDVIRRVLDGQSVESICDMLNRRGEPSPSDYVRIKNGQPSKGTKWRGMTVRGLLRRKSLLGHVTHNGVTVRDAQGLPILKGPPLITQDEYDRVQVALDARSKSRSRVAKASPLLQVLFCYDCGHPMYYRNAQNGKYRNYYCLRCGGRQIPADWAEELVEQKFLWERGACRVIERVFVPAEDHQTALNEAVRAVDELSALAGTVTSETMRQRLTGQLRALDERIAELEQQPSRDARWEEVETDQTYAEAWADADVDERRNLLRTAGITAKLTFQKNNLVGELHRRQPKGS